jgi:transcription elongation factor Elf1
MTSKSSSNELIQQTLSFLNAASLAVSDCNIVSAHLNRQISSRVAHVSKTSSGSSRLVDVDEQRKFLVCGSCGSWATEGNALFEIVRKGEKKLHAPRVAEKSGKVKVENRKQKGTMKEMRMKCLVCGHGTRTGIHPTMRHDAMKSKGREETVHASEPQAQSLSSIQSIYTPKTSSVSLQSTNKPLSRKQRQKQSKAGSSLQAMLQKSKENEKQVKSGFGLDIMDLMKLNHDT